MSAAFEEPFHLMARLKWLEKGTWGKRRMIIGVSIISSLIIVLTVLPMANIQEDVKNDSNLVQNENHNFIGSATLSSDVESTIHVGLYYMKHMIGLTHQI